MTNTTKHTPTPWHTAASPCTISRKQEDFCRIADCISPEDAAHIVRCVNAHEELVEALTHVYRRIPDSQAGDLGWVEALLEKVGAPCKAESL